MESHPSLSSQNSVLNHGIDELELTSALTDLEVVDEYFAAALDFVYKFELISQNLIMVLVFLGGGSFGDAFVGSIRANYFVAVAFASWIIETVISYKIGLMDPVARLIQAAWARRLNLTPALGVMYVNYFFVQFSLGGLSMTTLERSTTWNELSSEFQSWTLHLICAMLFLKTFQYFLFFLLKAWTYIFRLVPCCDYLLSKLKARPIRRFLKNNLIDRKTKGDDDEMCTICHAGLNKDSIVRMQCGHEYHQYCIGKWLFISTKCPLCKQDVDLSYIPEKKPLLQQHV